jgi:hypothetical protein
LRARFSHLSTFFIHGFPWSRFTRIYIWELGCRSAASVGKLVNDECGWRLVNHFTFHTGRAAR